MNGRNKTKLAVLFFDSKPVNDWYSWQDAYFEAIYPMSDRFNLRVFGYSDNPVILKRGNVELHLTDNVNSQRYWLSGFNPKIVLGVGKSLKDSPAELKDFIGSYVSFDTEGKHFVNTKLFKDEGMEKTIYCVTDSVDIANSLSGIVVVVGERSDFVMSIPSRDDDILEISLNQSVSACFVNSTDLAYKALACNVPTITTGDSKVSKADGVWAVPRDDIPVAIGVMLKSSRGVDLRDEHIVGIRDHKVLEGELISLIDGSISNVS